MWEEANAEQLQPCNPGSDSLLVLLTQLGFPNQYENQHLTVRTGLSDCKDGSKHATRACPGYASDILNGTSLKPTNAHSGTFTVTEPVKPTLTSFAWLHDRRVLGVISSSSATSVLKPFFRMLVFSNREVADWFPVHKRSFRATTFPATRLITTVNTSVSKPMSEIILHQTAVKFSGCFQVVLEGCSRHKRNLVCLGLRRWHRRKKAATEKRYSTGLDGWFCSDCFSSAQTATMWPRSSAPPPATLRWCQYNPLTYFHPTESQPNPSPNRPNVTKTSNNLSGTI